MASHMAPAADPSIRISAEFERAARENTLLT
jgi:hypothetical protein